MSKDIEGALQELVEQQAALQRRKEELRKERDAQFQQKYTALRGRMQELDQSALEHRKARHALLRRMAELQESEEASKLRRLDFERETWEVQRGLQLEKMARQMADNCPVKEQRRKLEDKQRLRLRTLDAIEEERIRRRRAQECQLKDSLDHAKHLQRHSVEGEHDPVASALEAGEEFWHEEGAGGFDRAAGLVKIAAEIDVIRRRAARESIRAHEALRRKLNEQRLRLAGETDKTDVKMQQLRSEQAAGLKALVREDLGPAAFQILATPAPPEITSTWVSAAALREEDGGSEPPNQPKRRRGSRHGDDGDEPGEEIGGGGSGDDEIGSSRCKGRGGQPQPGGATTAVASLPPTRTAEEAEAELEAREDASRSAAIAAFLREASPVGQATATKPPRGSALKWRRRSQAKAGAWPWVEGGRRLGAPSSVTTGLLRERERERRESARRVRIASGRTDDDHDHDNDHDHDHDDGRGGRQVRGSGVETEGESEEAGERSEQESGESEEEGEAEDESGEEEEEGSVVLDAEAMVAELREREEDAVSRIEALRLQAESLAQEKEWLATGALGKGHAWATLARLVGEEATQSGGDRGAGPHRLALEGDRVNVKEARRALEEGARIAKMEEELCTAVSNILDECISEEIGIVHGELVSASQVVLGVVGLAVTASAAAAAERYRTLGGGGGGSGSKTSVQTLMSRRPAKRVPGAVDDLLFSTFRELTASSGGIIRGVRGAEEVGRGSGGGGYRAARAADSDPAVLRLREIQPYRPPRDAELRQGERFYLRHMSADRFSVDVPKGNGFVTAITVGPAIAAAAAAAATATAIHIPAFLPADWTTSASAGGAFLLAAGTSKGGIAVWAMPCREGEEGSSGAGAGNGSRKKGSGGGRQAGGGLLLRVASPASLPKDDRCPVKLVRLGADGCSQLVSLDFRGTVKVWDIGGGNNTTATSGGSNAGGGGAIAAARDVLPNLRDGGVVSFKALTLSARWTIRETDLTRPLLDAGTASWLKSAASAVDPEGTDSTNTNKSSKEKKKEKAARGGGSAAEDGSLENGGSWPVSKKRDLAASVVAFHTAMTALGGQPSVVVATAGGSLVKCNSDAWAAVTAEEAVGDGGAGGGRNRGAGGVIYGRCPVSIEPGDRGAPQNTRMLRNKKGAAEESGKNPVRREFFERHRRPVIFVGFQDRLSLTMITLDTSGLLCVWPYSADAFSGLGWYTPSKEVLVDVTLQTYKREADRGSVGRARGGGDTDYIYNSALPPASSETSDRQEALGELKAGGFSLWSTRSLATDGYSETHIVSTENRGGSRGEASLLPAIVMRYDAEGELRWASRVRVSEGAREGKITGARLTVSGGELAVAATYRPVPAGSGGDSGGGGGRDAVDASLPGAGSDGSSSGTTSSLVGTIMVFLVDLKTLRLLPQHVRHEWSTTESLDSFPSPAFAVSPVLDATGSDYVYLAIGDSIRIFSFETGQEVVGSSGGRLLADNRGGINRSKRNQAAAASDGASSHSLAAASASPVVAAEVTPDNGTLAVAFAGSGSVALFRLRDDSMDANSQQRGGLTTAPSASSDGIDRSDRWRNILRGRYCGRRQATPWEMRVHLTTPFAAGEFEGLGHRDGIRRVIVGGIVEKALALVGRSQPAKRIPMNPLEGVDPAAVVPAVGGRVSLRALLGEPPYGAV